MLLLHKPTTSPHAPDTFLSDIPFKSSSSFDLHTHIDTGDPLRRGCHPSTFASRLPPSLASSLPSSLPLGTHRRASHTAFFYHMFVFLFFRLMLHFSVYI